MDMSVNFDFPEGTYSHMPYVAHGNGEIRQVCCLMVNGLWKVHQFSNGRWQRVYTGLPEDATECSPLAAYDVVKRHWNISFIGGGYDGSPGFSLYLIEDVDSYETTITKIISADAGFCWKDRIVYCGRSTSIFVSFADFTRKVTIKNLDYIYRVTNYPQSPNELIVSATIANELTTLLINTEQPEVKTLTVHGEVPYKACLFYGTCHYAKKIGEGYEDRRIVSSGSYEMSHVPFFDAVDIRTVKGGTIDEEFE